MVNTVHANGRRPYADGTAGSLRPDRGVIAGYAALTGLVSLMVLAAASWIIFEGGMDSTDFLLFIFLLLPLLPGLLLAEGIAFAAERRIARPRSGWRLYAGIYATHILGPIVVAYLLGVTIAALLDRRGAYFSVAELFAAHAALLWIPAVTFCVAGLLLLPVLKVMRRHSSGARPLPATA